MIRPSRVQGLDCIVSHVEDVRESVAWAIWCPQLLLLREMGTSEHNRIGIGMEKRSASELLPDAQH